MTACILLLAYIPIGLLTSALAARLFGDERAGSIGIIWPFGLVLIATAYLLRLFEWAAKKGAEKE